MISVFFSANTSVSVPLFPFSAQVWFSMPKFHFQCQNIKPKTLFSRHKHDWKIFRRLVKNRHFCGLERWSAAWRSCRLAAPPPPPPPDEKLSPYTHTGEVNYVTLIPLVCRNLRCQHFILATGLSISLPFITPPCSHLEPLHLLPLLLFIF